MLKLLITMLRLLILRWRLYTVRYALDSCHQMIADATASIDHYKAQERKLVSELAMVELDRRYG